MRSLRYVFLCFVALLTVTGCGGCDEPSGKDPCEDVVCDNGVCDPDTTSCVNASSCTEGSTDCLDGYACVSGECVAEFACSDAEPCDRGECVNGACVNPDRCEVTNDCVPGFACDGDACVANLCANVDCGRGVCDQGTGECVNAAACTEQTQDTDCIDGFVCYGQTCADEATICGDLACMRGVCSYVDRQCVNAEDCAGSDTNCMEGFFCNAGNQCQANVCTDDACVLGVCDPATGDCVNATQCTDASECTDGFWCVGNTCETQADACATECEGNQVCDYDDGGLRVVCSENPNGCSSSVDCIGNRFCNGGTCGPAEPCVADGLEPNDSAAAATDWFATVGTSGQITASICATDADFFAYDTNDDPDFTGRLIAIATIDPSDVGLGALQMEILDPSGASVATTTSQASDPFVRVSVPVGAVDQGEYSVVVRDAGDLTVAGIDYTLFIDLVETATYDLCQAAPTLMTSSTGDTSQSMSNAMAPSCAFEPSGAEEVWILDVVDASFVTVNLVATGFDSVLSLRTACEADASEVACANRNPAGTSEQIAQILDPGTYYVVVTGNGSSESGAYTLNVSVEPVLCTPADNMCVDMMTAQVCNPRGTGFDSIACDAGCDLGLGNCIREAGDACSAAINATGGFSGTIDFSTLTNEFDPGVGGCVPQGFFGSATDGADAVFSITLQDNEVLTAATSNGGFEDVSLYLVTACGDEQNSCVEAENSGTAIENLTWVNASGAAQDLFLIVDSESFATGSVTVDITVDAVICTPGTTQCNGGDLETCNATGTAYDARTCAFGCDMLNNSCVLPPNDMCGAGAIDVSAGGTFTGSTDDYNSDYSATNACTGFSAPGPDMVYVITGTAGDIVDVTLNASFDGSLYAVTDCSDIAGTCLDGNDGFTGIENITFVLPSAAPVYIVVDSFLSSASGTFSLTVNVSAPDCTTYGQPIACTDSTTLQYCNSIGLFEDYDCGGTCTGAACDSPLGDRCFDAIPAGDGDRLSGDYSDLNPTIDPGVGTCIASASAIQDGPDAVYSLNLTAGDLLQADLTTNAIGAGMYVMTDCDDNDSCVWAQPSSKELEFFAATSGTYYLVVDSTSTSASGAFTLDVNIDSGFACQPGASVCDPGTDTVTVCADDGLSVENTIFCNNGCGGPGLCAPPTTAPDTCATAHIVSGPVRFLETWGRFANDLDAVAGGATCNTTDTDGPDAVYEVALSSGQVVEVNVDDLGTTGSPSAMIVSDCATPETSCLAGDGSIADARVGYIASGNETVFVIVDNSNASVTGNFSVDIDIRTAECGAGFVQCSDATTLQFCDEFGRLDETTCFGGCVAGACNPVTNEVCDANAFDVSAGGTYSGSIDDFTNDYSATSACTGFSANGKDATFSITGNAGDIVSVDLNADFDASLYAVTDCADIAGTCLDGSDRSGRVEAIQFVLPASQVFVVVDGFSSTATGDFTVSIDIQAPECMNYGEAVACQDANNLEFCNSLGLLESYRCDGGCSAGACTAPTGDRCFDAVPVTSGSVESSTYQDFSNFADPGVGTCVLGAGNEMDGPDAFYSITLTAGDLLTVDLTTVSFGSSLYLLSSCGDVANSCVIAAEETDQLVFFAETGGDYVLVVDSTSSSSASTFDVEFQVTSGLACLPGGSTCDSGTGTQTICQDDGSGIADTIVCPNGCGPNGLCAAPTTVQDTCAAPFVITGGARFYERWDRFANDLDATADGATCVGGETDGPDLVYQVSLNAGDVVDVQVDDLGETGSPAIYIVSDCGSLSTSCLAGASNTSNARTGYIASATETVYVVIDNSSSFANDPMVVDIDVRTADCAAGFETCLDASTRQFCTDVGTLQEENCFFGCSAGVCAPPANDTCTGPIDGSGGGTWTFNLDDFADDYNPTSAGCTGFGAAGADGVWLVSATAGEVIRATLSSAFDGSLYALATCGDTASCLDGSDGSGDETIQFAAPTTGDYFIVADAFSASASGEFTLTIEVLQPICTPGTVQCDALAENLEICDSAGLAYDVSPCDSAGCQVGLGQCVNPSGEICADAIDANGGGNFSGDYADHSNQYNLVSGTSCTGYATPGADIAYVVDLMAGQTVSADLIGGGADDTALYIVTDCADIDNTCLAGDDAFGTFEHVDYTASGAETVFIIVDAFDSDASDTYDLSIVIQ